MDNNQDRRLQDEFITYITHLDDQESLEGILTTAITHFRECEEDPSFETFMYEVRKQLIENAILFMYRESEVVQEHLIDFMRQYI